MYPYSFLLDIMCESGLRLILVNKKRYKGEYMATIKDVAKQAGVSVTTVSIIINGKARLGDFCDLHSCVNIGQNGGKENSINTPTIGDRVWIGPGAKLFGKITITDGCQIGANAIVNKSFDTPGSVIAGCPAKVLKVLPIYVSAD